MHVADQLEEQVSLLGESVTAYCAAILSSLDTTAVGDRRRQTMESTSPESTRQLAPLT